MGNPQAQIRKDIVGQLVGAGYALPIAEQNAALVEALYGTNAVRRGLGETAADLFRQDNITISNAAGQQEAGALGQTFMQSDQFAQVGAEQVDGLTVREDIPNTDSIAATFTNYEVLPGVRNIPVSAFDQTYVPEKTKRVRELSEAIKESGEINPLIVAMDKDGLYILEGGHRYDALRLLGKQAIPALIVKDLDSQTLPGAEGQTFAQGGTVNVDGVERSTQNSNGQPIGKTQEAIENFWRWFGDSKVVDDQGRPMVVYHGTGAKFSTFNTKKATQGILWFTSDKTKVEAGEVGAQGKGVIMEMYAKVTTPADWKQYDKLGLYEFKREGLDGAMLKESDGAFDGFVFDPTQLKSVENKGAFSSDTGNIYKQTFGKGDKPKGNRAEVTFGDRAISIKLLENADLSSFIHELSHVGFAQLFKSETVLNAIPVDQRTPVQLKLLEDADTLRKWLKHTDGPLTAAQQEQLSEGFENYVMEGKAPSQSLREAFAGFRQWFIQVYQRLTSAYPGVKLTKSVREVFDRMIATDEAIDEAAAEANVHPMFLSAESAGMTPTRFNAYRETVAEASLSAREGLQKKLMAQLQRQDQKWWKERRAELVQTITAQVNDQNEYVALAVLQTGKLPDGGDLADGITPMKLDKKAVADQFGADFLTTMPTGTMLKGGMHPDTAAPLFGFNSGQEMIMAMVNARPKNELIEAEADRQMIAQYGDMRFDGTIAEEAKAAVLNDQREAVIHAELKALKAKAREVSPFVKAAQAETEAQEKVGRDLLRTGLPTLKDTRELARKILSRAALKTIKPNEYIVTARQASRNATKALAKKDYLDALKFKERELLNLALYREANIIRDQVDAARELASDFFGSDATLAKSRNVDLVNIGRAILAQHGLGNQTEKTAAEYLAPIQHYDIDLYNQWKQVVDALAPRQLDYRALTVEEFTRLHEDMQALWLLSRRVQQAKIDGQLVDRQQMIDELSAVMAQFTPKQIKDVAGPQSEWSDTKIALLSWGSALRRVESWVDAMDAGAINGPFRRYIWNPISEAADLFVDKKVSLLTKYHELLKPIQGTITKDLITADELKPGFFFGGRVALLHALLHSGNESNFDKFIRGYKLNGTQWQAFIDRMIQEGKLTKADYDYAQGVWDLLESLKPDTQKAHHEMYGFYFNEITAKPITTPWGEYKGGYVPAKIDPAKSASQDIRDEKNLFDQGGNSFNFPTTGRGATRTRIQQVAEPLALDLTTIPIHLDWAMRFTYLEPRIKDAARLITNKELRASLDAMNSTAAKDMLVPWLQRSAQQTVSTPGRNKHADRLWKYLRKTSGAQIMVGNVLNTLQQLTGFSQSLLKVKAKHMRGALVNYLRHPVQYADDIASRSLFMKNRTSTQVMEIQSSIDDILLNPTKYEKAKKFADRHGYFMQQGTQSLVDLITWGAAYDQAHAQGLDEKMAVRSADSAVRETQGSFAPQDISNFEAGTPFTRAFTMFYSYFNMQANLLGTEFSKVAQDMGLRNGAGRAFYIYLVGFMIPAMVAETIVKGMGGFDPDDDDDYLNESLSVFFGSQLRSALAFFPGVGPATLAGINMFNDKWYDDRISTSPVVSMIEASVRVPHDLYKVMSDDGHSKRAVKDVLTLIGLITGLPAGSLARPLGYLADVNDGKANPEDAGDVARGLLSGRDVNRTK